MFMLSHGNADKDQQPLQGTIKTVSENRVSDGQTRFLPYWWEAAEPKSVPEAPVAERCDVAIIGAGYTGLSAAITLARAGRNVQIFDRQRPGEGASSRNGGITSGNIRIGLSAAIEKYGEAKGLALYREGVEARKDLQRFIHEEKLDCDFVLSGRFTGCISDDHYDIQARETDLLNRHLNIGGYVVPKEEQHKETGSAMYRGGVVRPDIGMLHPGKFVQEMIRVAVESGAILHGETPVTGFERVSDGYVIHTTRGKTVARDLIFAANGYIDGANKWLRRRIVPIPSCMIATEPLSPNLMKTLMPAGRGMGETRKLYRYFRPSPDGRRILLGGRSSMFGRSEAESGAHLLKGLIEMYPELSDTKISHSWNGLVAFSRSDIPLLFQRDGAHYTGGYCGSGVVWARWIGQKAALKILGSPEGASAFDCDPPPAVPFFNGRTWFLPAVLGWHGLLDKLGRGVVKA